MEQQTLLSLPLDLLPIILEETVVTVSVSDALSLRLVNRTFDYEVLRAIASRRILLGKNDDLWKARVPWHQAIDYDRRDESASEFWVRYFLGRPHQKDPQNCSFPLLLNNVLDVVLEQAGKTVDHPCRRRYMRLLLNEAIPRLVGPGRSHKHLRLSQRPWLGQYIGTKPGRSITHATFDLHVLHAQLILGYTEPCRRLLRSGELSPGSLRDSGISTAFATSPYAIIRSGSTDLVREVFPATDKESDIAGTPLAHLLLSCAVETRNFDMVRLLMETPEGREPRPTRLHYEMAVMRAIHLREQDITRYLLSKATDRNTVYLVHEGLRAAAQYGDNETLSWMLSRAREKSLGSWIFDCCATPMELACRAGRMETVHLLLEYGLDPRGKDIDQSLMLHSVRCPHSHPRYPILHKHGYLWADRSAGSMFWAAINGYTHIAEALIDAGIQISEYEWRVTALAAVELDQTEFLQWMIDSGNLARWYGTEVDSFGQRRHHITIGKPDLVGHVCVWGSPETLRMLVSSGYTVEGPLCAESHRYGNIILAAMKWARPDMVRVLYELGLQEPDPLQFDVHGFGKSGEFPRRARTRPLADGGMTHYPSLVPPSAADESS